MHQQTFLNWLKLLNPVIDSILAFKNMCVLFWSKNPKAQRLWITSWCDVGVTGFQEQAEIFELFHTDFQMRLLWGSKGAEEIQTLRYAKFDQVLTALSNKLEPPVRPRWPQICFHYLVRVQVGWNPSVFLAVGGPANWKVVIRESVQNRDAPRNRNQSLLRVWCLCRLKHPQTHHLQSFWKKSVDAGWWRHVEILQHCGGTKNRQNIQDYRFIAAALVYIWTVFSRTKVVHLLSFITLCMLNWGLAKAPMPESQISMLSLLSFTKYV